MKRRVMIVDDSNFIRATLRDILRDNEWEVVAEAATGEDALDLFDKNELDLVTLDNILPDMTGIDVLRAIREKDQKLPVLMISSIVNQSVIQDARDLGVIEYIPKPFEASHIAAQLPKD